MTFTSTDGSRIFFEVRGEGPTVALVHGGLVHSVTWAEATAGLVAAGFRVLTHDVRGYGRSDRPSEAKAYTIRRSADDLAELIDHLETGPVHLVGFSQGGMIAMALAGERPALVRSLVLVSTTARMTPAQAELFRARAARIESMGLDDESRVYLSRAFSASFAAAHPDLLAAYAAIVGANEPAALAATFRGLAAADLRSPAARVRAATLILAGAEDVGMDPKVHASRLHALIPDSVLEVWPSVGHTLFLEDGAAFVSRVSGFLRNARSGPDRAPVAERGARPTGKGREMGEETKIWELEGVLAREAHRLEWLPLAKTPGLDGLDIPGVSCKYLGKDDKGPWVYMVRQEPGVQLARHRHTSNVMHYLIEGSWLIAGLEKGPGWFHYEHRGQEYGPILSGERGSLYLAIHDAKPDFIPVE
ncbi:MAG: alpha/beta fold hydrolase [Candidatus Rokuibacteriota bacterium]